MTAGTPSSSVSDHPVALVTGAGSGIGRATAVALSRQGYRLALVGRRVEPLRETGALLPDGTAWTAIACDVGDADAVRHAVDATVGGYGRIDAVINSAGFAPRMPIGEHTPAVIDEVFRVNALGPAYVIAAAWPIFESQGHGCIVNVSSMATVDPFSGFFAYAAAKASTNLMAKSCVGEARSLGIRAFAVAPGAVETPMLRRIFPAEAIPPEKCLTPEAVARVIVDCVLGKHDERNGEVIYLPSP